MQVICGVAPRVSCLPQECVCSLRYGCDVETPLCSQEETRRGVLSSHPCAGMFERYLWCSANALLRHYSQLVHISASAWLLLCSQQFSVSATVMFSYTPAYQECLGRVTGSALDQIQVLFDGGTQWSLICFWSLFAWRTPTMCSVVLFQYFNKTAFRGSELLVLLSIKR